MTKESKSTASELRQVEKLLKLDPTNTELLAQKQTLLAKSIETTKEKLETLKEAEKQAQQQFENGDISEEQYRALQREIAATETSLERLREQASLSNSTLQGISDTTGKIGTASTNAGKALAPVSAAVAGIGAAAVAVSADFESALSQVQATLGITKDEMTELDGSTVNTMDALSELAQEMGSTTSFTATEAAEAINYMALAGKDVDEIYNMLPDTLNLAAAGNMGIADASNMVTNAMAALGVETEDTEKFVDQMAKTASNSGTTVEELGEGLLTVGANAANLAGGTAEANTALGILADSGFHASEGGTHLRNIIKSLQDPTSDAAKTMEELGVKVYDAEGNMRSLNDILGDIGEATKDMTNEGKDGVLNTLFNTRDSAAAKSLIEQTGESWDELQSKIENSEGSAEEMAATQLDNLKGQITLIKSALEGLAIELGRTLMPIVKDVVEWAQQLVEKFAGMDDKTKELIVKIGLFVAALSPVLLVFGGVMTAVSKVTGAIAGAIAKIAGAGGLGSALAGLASPVGIAIGAIAAFAGGFAYLYKTNEEFRQKMDELKEKIGTAFGEMLEKARPALEGLKEALGQLMQALEPIITFIAETMGNAILALLDAFPYVIETITGIIELISNIIGAVTSLLTGDIEGFQEHIGLAGQAIIDIIVGFAMAIGTFLQTFLAAMWEAIKGLFAGACAAIKAIFQGVGQWFGDRFMEAYNAITGIWTGIGQWFGQRWNEIVSVFQGVGSWFTGIFQQAWNGIQGVFANFGGFFSGLWSTIQSTFGNLGTNISNAIGSAVKSGINGVISMIQTTINSAIGVINGAIGLINKIPGVSVGRVRTVSLPMLAKGGMLRSGQAIVGESGPELIDMVNGKTIVTPLTGNKTRSNVQNATGAAGEMQPIKISLNIENFNNERKTDIKRLTEEIMEEAQRAKERYENAYA